MRLLLPCEHPGLDRCDLDLWQAICCTLYSLHDRFGAARQAEFEEQRPQEQRFRERPGRVALEAVKTKLQRPDGAHGSCTFCSLQGGTNCSVTGECGQQTFQVRTWPCILPQHLVCRETWCTRHRGAPSPWPELQPTQYPHKDFSRAIIHNANTQLLS